MSQHPGIEHMHQGGPGFAENWAAHWGDIADSSPRPSWVSQPEMAEAEVSGEGRSPGWGGRGGGAGSKMSPLLLPLPGQNEVWPGAHLFIFLGLCFHTCGVWTLDLIP